MKKTILDNAFNETDQEDLDYILIVDDESEPRELILDALEPIRNYIKIEAVDEGLKALERIQLKPPSLLLLDIVMKGKVDGYDVLRESNKFNDIFPVIMMSGYYEGEDKDLISKMAIKGNIDQSRIKGVLRKPFMPQDIVNLLKEVPSIFRMIEKTKLQYHSNLT